MGGSIESKERFSPRPFNSKARSLPQLVPKESPGIAMVTRAIGTVGGDFSARREGTGKAGFLVCI